MKTIPAFVKTIGFVAALIAFLCASNPLQAEDKTWTGSAGGSWLDGGNWFPSPLVSEVDSVVYDSSSAANPDQTLDQDWSIAGLRVLDAPGPITIAPGAGDFVLINTAGIDMSAATADLTILADYHPLNSGSLHVAAGRTLTLSNILNNINNTTDGATAGAGTVRILGQAQRLTRNVNSITVIVDGGSINANAPLHLAADPDATVTAIVTNNGSVNVTGGNGQRILLGALANSNSTNHFILDGGTVHVTGSSGSSANGIIVGHMENSIGILDINDGFIDLSHRTESNQRSFLRVANAPGAVGIVNLNAGGLIRGPRIETAPDAPGTAIFNFNGGTFAASLVNPFFEDFAEVNLLEGGGTIDTETTLRVVTIPVSVSGPGGLNKVGLGTLTLAGPNNSHAGPTVVHAGDLNVTLPMSSSTLTMAPETTLGVTAGSVPGASWPSASITLEGDHILTFTYGPDSAPATVLLNTTTLTAAGTNVINIEGAGWPEGTIRLIDYDGGINGDGIFVLGSMPVGLNAQLTNNTATSSIDLVVSSSVNELDWWGFTAFGDSGGGLWDIATSLNWNEGTSLYNEYGAGENQLGDSVRFIPNVNTHVEVAATVRPSAVVITNLGAAAYLFVGPGKISGPASLVKQGDNNNSEMTLALTNDYTGGTFIHRGRLFLGTDNALPIDGLVHVGSPGVGAFLHLNGFHQTVGGVIATGSGSGNRRVINGGDHVTFTINVAADEMHNYSHQMGDNSAAIDHANNNFSIVKAGPGIQIFGNSHYSGATTISGGTLLFNGANVTIVGGITVQSGATLGGSGSAGNGPVTVQPGGRLEPGNLAIGTLTVNDTVTLQGETVMELNRAGAQNSDRLAATSVSLGGILTGINLGEALQAGDTFTLFSGALSGGFSTLNLPELPSGWSWNTDNLTLDGSISVVAPVLPSFVSATISNGDIVLSGTGGAPGGTYQVLTSTDVASPLATWTVIATDEFDGSGAFSISIPMGPGEAQQYYSLQVP